MIAQKNASPIRKLEAEPEYFIKAPTLIMYADFLSDAAKVLYCILRDYQGKNEYSWPAVETLASNIHKSERQTRNLLRELERAEVIEIIERPGHSSFYSCVLPELKTVPAPDEQPEQTPQPPANEPTATAASQLEQPTPMTDQADEETARTAQRHANIMAILDARLLPDEPIAPAAAIALAQTDESVATATPEQGGNLLPEGRKKIAPELDSRTINKTVCESRLNPRIQDVSHKKHQASPSLNYQSLTEIKSAKAQNLETQARDKSHSQKSTYAQHMLKPKRVELTPEQAEIVALFEKASIAKPIALELATASTSSRDYVERLIKASQRSRIYDPAGFIVFMARNGAEPTTTNRKGRMSRGGKQEREAGSQQQEAGAVAYMRRRAEELAKWQNQDSAYTNFDEPIEALEPEQPPTATNVPQPRVYIRDGIIDRPVRSMERTTLTKW